MKYLILGLCLFVSPVIKSQDTKIAPQQSQTDLELLRSSLEEGHPALYKYYSKQEFDKGYKALTQLRATAIDKTVFYLALCRFIAKIQDGHTRMILPGHLRTYISDSSRSLLPLKLKFLGKKIFVLENYTSNLAIAPGSEVVSINKIGATALYNQLAELVSADEGNPGFLNRRLDLEHDYLIPLLFKTPSSYTVSLKELNGITKQWQLPGMNQESITKRQVIKSSPPSREYFTKTTADQLVGILTIRDFLQRPDPGYFNFLDSVFNDISAKKVGNLVIDLRENVGGYDEHAIALLSKLVKGKFRYYDKTFITKTNYSFLGFTNAAHYNKMVASLKPVQEKNGNYRIALPWEEKYKDKEGQGYEGQLYILINERTFSSGTIVAIGGYNYANALLIGEPTGGAYAGSTGASVLLTLPDTKFMLQLPLVMSEYAVQKSNKGKGLQPTYLVRPGIMDIIRGQDKVMEFTLKLITKK
ncbi:MAG: S41 family peptidase [Chitinophagaceae bacterium]